MLTALSGVPFGLAGARYDPRIAGYALGSRCYDPALGRFTTRDTWPSNVWEPWTWNLYQYCKNSPQNYVDPTGHNELAATAREFLENPVVFTLPELAYLAAGVASGALPFALGAAIGLAASRIVEKMDRHVYFHYGSSSDKAGIEREVKTGTYLTKNPFYPSFWARQVLDMHVPKDYVYLVVPYVQGSVQFLKHEDGSAYGHLGGAFAWITTEPIRRYQNGLIIGLWPTTDLWPREILQVPAAKVITDITRPKE